MYSVLSSFFNKFSSHIVLYHATFSQIPENLTKNLHNVIPEEIYKQLSWYKKQFEILTLDEFFEQKARKGTVAFTFDDAYSCVFDEALPVFETLDIPFTVFVNGISLEKKPFWRDKVRYLINTDLVQDFLTKNQKFANNHSLTINNFYKQSKHFSINSRSIDSLLDEFFTDNGIDLSGLCYCVTESNQLINHPLITYGNHTYNHYVLSSLSKREQEDEIAKNHELLKKLNLSLTQVFSIPFGGDKDFNNTTLELFKAYNYTHFLYSRNKFNFAFSGVSADRYMMPDTFNSFQKMLTQVTFKSLLSFKN